MDAFIELSMKKDFKDITIRDITTVATVNELRAFFSEWAQKQRPNQNKVEIDAFSVMLSWALYGAAMHWMQNQTTKPEEYVKELMNFINKHE